MTASPAARPTHGPRLSVWPIARSSSSAAAPASPRADQLDAVSSPAIANGSAMLRIAASGTGWPIVEPGRMLGHTNTSHPADWATAYAAIGTSAATIHVVSRRTLSRETPLDAVARNSASIDVWAIRPL